VSDKFKAPKTRSSSITTVVSISLVLFMLGLLGLIILDTKKLSDHIRENIGFQLYLHEGTTAQELAGLQHSLDSSGYVKSQEYISKEKALELYKEQVGKDFTDFIGHNPLPASIDMRLKADYTNNDSIVKIKADLLKHSAIEEFQYRQSIISSVNENARKLGIVILFFSALLMVIALALINHTIRLSIYSKRFLIKTMQLVGATQGFIRRPFIFKAIRHGIYASLIAIILLGVLIYLAEIQIPELADLRDNKMLLILFGVIFLLGIIISGISTSLAVRKYLRIRSHDLYY
jgi:cell division transport system permease protein